MTKTTPSSRRPARTAQVQARRSRAALVASLALALGAAWLGTASAHGTLVRGALTLDPDPPRAGRPMVLSIELAKTNNDPVEGAELVAELKPAAARGPGAPAGPSASAGTRTFPLQEYREPYGTYRAELTAPPAGSYTLTVHDRTEPGEDTTAAVPVRIGGDVANGDLGFTFPGGAGSSHPLATWLIWLVGVPLAVGIVVTVLMRRAGRAEAPPDRHEG